MIVVSKHMTTRLVIFVLLLLCICFHRIRSQRDHRSFLSWECQEELFRQEVENADDIRLSVRLLRKCMGDKRKHCADITFGAGWGAAEDEPMHS